MLDNFTTFLKKKGKKEPADKSKNAAKERLHLVLMQDRANVSADFLEMMKLEIVDVIKKYIDVATYTTDDNYKNSWKQKGCPEDYAEKLAQLHAIHPNWTFTPSLTGDQTPSGMDFNYSVNGEYRDIAHPINQETRQMFQEAVFEAYKNAE